MQLRWSAKCWSEAHRVGGHGDHWCPPMALLNEVFSFVLCYMSLVPRFLGLRGSGCAHMRDGSGLTDFGFHVGLKHFSNCAVSGKTSLLKQISGASAPKSQSAFSYCISCSGRSCFLSLRNLCLSLRKACFCWVVTCKSLLSCCVAVTRHWAFPMR